MEEEHVVVRMSPHDTIIAALTMEAVVDMHDSTGKPIYEPMVYARVCDIADEYHYPMEVTPKEFMHMLSILETVNHVFRIKRTHPNVGLQAPHIVPTMFGRRDILGARPLLRKVLHNGV